MSGSSVNRCIAVAAHGRRCQQTTFRGSPYCWHHTQSRKLPAPSRVQATRRRGGPVEIVVEPVLAPLEVIARDLSADQLDALARFLTGSESGTFVLDKQAGEIVGARAQNRTPRLHGRRVELPYPGKRELGRVR